MAITKTKILSGLLVAGLTTGIILFNTNYSNNEEKDLKPTKNDQQPTAKVKLGIKYKAALIDENSIWRNRFNDLKKGNPKHPDLLAAKPLNNEIGPWKLQEGCQKIINGEDGENYFSDFEQFCVMKNKDETRLINDKNGFGSKYDLFSKANKNKLSKAFADIWENKGAAVNDDWKERMLSECQRLQEKMYVGDTEDENFSKYCEIKN